MTKMDEVDKSNSENYKSGPNIPMDEEPSSPEVMRVDSDYLNFPDNFTYEDDFDLFERFQQLHGGVLVEVNRVLLLMENLPINVDFYLSVDVEKLHGDTKRAILAIMIANGY